MAWSTMVSLELGDDDKLDLQLPAAIEDMPSYPYGTQISLTHRELEKFGLDAGDFKVGDVILLKCAARISGTNCRETPMGPEERVEMQITDMAIMGEGEGDDE